jgi:hypothetical protein
MGRHQEVPDADGCNGSGVVDSPTLTTSTMAKGEAEPTMARIAAAGLGLGQQDDDGDVAVGVQQRRVQPPVRATGRNRAASTTGRQR